MADIEKTEFRFPDENNEVEPGAVNAADEVEVEIVDDTPDVDKGRKPMKEAPAEVTDDELEQYSEGVKKRIQHFSKGYHEERRAKEAALREREEAVRLADIDRMIASYQGWASREDAALAPAERDLAIGRMRSEWQVRHDAVIKEYSTSIHGVSRAMGASGSASADRAATWSPRPPSPCATGSWSSTLASSTAARGQPTRCSGLRRRRVSFSGRI